MSLRIQCTVVDAADPPGLARFWADVLGWDVTLATAKEAALEPPGALNNVVPDLLFVACPDERAGKNRLHLDLRPHPQPPEGGTLRDGAIGDQDAEVARVIALGATRADLGQGDAPWVVLRDPEGNEFCVLPPLSPEDTAEVAAAQPPWTS